MIIIIKYWLLMRQRSFIIYLEIKAVLDLLSAPAMEKKEVPWRLAAQMFPAEMFPERSVLGN